MSQPDQTDLFFDELAREAYRRWQMREEDKDGQAQAAHNKLIIENGDPECEKVIAALEKGWLEDQGRF